METVLVIGAAGKLGVPAARQLKSGFNIRVFDKNKMLLSKLFGEGYDPVAGDIFDQKNLNYAMRGCYGVHINLSGEVEQSGTEAIINAAKNNNIGRISYLSSSSVDKNAIWSPLAKFKYYAETAIMECGIPYSIFCTSWFMEIIPNFIRNSKAFVFGKQPNPYHFIAVEDYARMVLHAYQNKKAANKRFIIHGKEGYFFHTALKKYCAVMHPEIKNIETIPFWRAKLNSVITGKKDVRKMVGIMQFFQEAGEKGDPIEAYDLLGEPLITLGAWIERQTAINKSPGASQ